jgi:hypothetical protein
VFYAYFFQRFQEEVKDTWIIAMCYVLDEIAKAVVFDDSGTSEKLVDSSEIESAINATAKRARASRKKVLFLCDGPPNRVRRNGQMVVFTGPREKWLKAMRKNNATLYMPLWTCEELQEAAFALGLTELSEDESITEDAIETRFNIFGGVARECFLRSIFLVKMKQDELVNEIRKLTAAELNDLIRGATNSSLRHRVLHYVPDAMSNGFMVRTKLASPFIAQKLAERMLQLPEAERK